MVFQTKADARKVSKEPSRSGAVRKTIPYECPICGAWHLTSQSKAEARNNNKARIRRATKARRAMTDPEL